MADEKADQSVKKANSAPVSSSSQQPVRLPDEPNKPKRRRRRRSRRRGNNSKVPDSVVAEQNKLQDEVKRQEDARLGDLAKELKDDELEQKSAASEAPDKPKSEKLPESKPEPATQLPELKVNGKPYRPQTAKKNDQTDRKVRTALAGSKKQPTAKKIASLESPILSAMLAQKDVKLDDHKDDSKKESVDDKSKQTDKSERLAETKPEENVKNTDKSTKNSNRFTPRIDAGGMGTAPTFSLQDIQRARRRRRLLVTVVMMILFAAAWLFWAGIQKARESVGEAIEQRQAEVAPSATPQPHGNQKATLSGLIAAEGLRFPSVTLDRIAIYIRYGSEESFRDTGIRLMEGENEWSFSQAQADETYEVQAVLLDEGREIAHSDIVTAQAPAANILLTFPPEAIQAVPSARPEPKNEPVLQLDELPSISGVVTIHGQLPNLTQMVIWLGENTGGEQIRQDAYSFLISGSEIAYTISDLNADREYVMDAVVQTSDGEVLGTADKTIIAKPGTTNANFVITSN